MKVTQLIAENQWRFHRGQRPGSKGAHDFATVVEYSIIAGNSHGKNPFGGLRTVDSSLAGSALVKHSLLTRRASKGDFTNEHCLVGPARSARDAAPRKSYGGKTVDEATVAQVH